MQISRRADYGVRVILDLAFQGDDGRAPTQEIAARQGIPMPFLAKIVSQLALAGLVNTYRGAGGGVCLAKPSSEITLLHVIEALEGPIYLNRCLIEPEHCPKERDCPVHDIWCQAQTSLTSLLGETNFEQLVEAARAKAHAEH